MQISLQELKRLIREQLEDVDKQNKSSNVQTDRELLNSILGILSLADDSTLKKLTRVSGGSSAVPTLEVWFEEVLELDPHNNLADMLLDKVIGLNENYKKRA